jgi:pSer/pThr/pTyr-binding forkhead associated (FHA) protein
MDLTASPATSPPPSPPAPAPRSSRKQTRSLPRSALGSVVLTVRRCAAWPPYEGQRVLIPLPSPAPSPAKASGQRKSARKKSNDEAVTVTIGALEECQHVFEKDEFLSGRHVQLKLEYAEGQGEGHRGEEGEHGVTIRIKDLNSTNGTRRNGEDLQANRLFPLPLPSHPLILFSVCGQVGGGVSWRHTGAGQYGVPRLS